jgi:hypothetical protein
MCIFACEGDSLSLQFEKYIHATMDETHKVAVARKAQSPGKLDAIGAAAHRVAQGRHDIIAPLLRAA